MPTKVGIQFSFWIPAFAGKTKKKKAPTQSSSSQFRHSSLVFSVRHPGFVFTYADFFLYAKRHPLYAMTMNLEELIGQKIMIGVSGPEVTPEILKLFRETHAGGLILFRRNFRSAELLRKFILGLEECLGRKLLVAVDHEGGRVVHLAEGVTFFPDNLTLGNTGKEEYATAQGAIEAKELRRLGIDINLAPTVDVLTESFSPNIGIRAYGKDSDLVARLGAARIRAMQAGGLSACAKHFPGQGQSTLDAHLQFPVLTTSPKEIRKVHLKPFRAAIAAGVDTVMTSHPAYPGLECISGVGATQRVAPTDILPATFSKQIVTELLRHELKFQGVILSDDLEMGALRGISSVGESAVRAVEAGHDIVLICSKPELQREVYASLLAAYQNKKLLLKDLEESVERIQKLGAKRSERFAGGVPVAEPEGVCLAEAIAREGVRVVQQKAIGRVAPAEISIIFPRLSSLNSLIAIEKECLEDEKFIRTTMERAGIPVGNVCLVSLDPTEEEISEVSKALPKNPNVLFFCYDAHLYPVCRKCLELVETQAKFCGVIFLRDPYDVDFLKTGIPAIQAFGFRKAQIVAAVEKLKNMIFSCG